MREIVAVIGYARVSTQDQNLQLQLDALKGAGAVKIFEDQGMSGAKAERPALRKLLEHVREGDEVVVWKLDRIARNTRNLLDLVDEFKDLGVTFRSVTDGIDTTGPMGKAMITIMGALAELERDQIVERTKAGLESARERGRLGGRPRKATDAKMTLCKKMFAEGHPSKEIAQVLGLSRATVYRYVQV
ncbi:recombinase family protein [Arthrobacter bambusae]|uniref:recombinase family protein n=1 Tax=Arthrobacter bambusae TaxID=1338426 RepID=UPI002788B2C4|nr:recombinase family protein [Arthrobacter bambusae]MDQ0030143.1 DNA invertase Pin-like site-specific DNA recombinase [Arthrobacter bambusae]MDQ0097826.1 DNA invertase Pin-like site-specific DNA recombinase [Arthrobacter bambusae]